MRDAAPGQKLLHDSPTGLTGTLAAISKALGAGMAASRDYRHLSGMTDGQLKTLGLTRDQISAELHRRHFSQLGSQTQHLR